MSIIDQIKDKLSGKITGWQEHSAKRIYFSINPADIREVAGFLFNDLGLRFVIATGQDTPPGLEVLYHFSFDKAGQVITVRTLIEDKKNPQIDSIAPLFKGAEWIEREMWELLGINFTGHPNLTRLLLAEEWPEGKYPLRHNHES
ncbi:MAG: NADH-quinone oxidoreductase subunit C [Candidatus Omnitrophica bacterium]|nr:NADH-quinone oxidoreductase subunit C [Candidatus Omnitrophota bacterium]